VDDIGGTDGVGELDRECIMKMSGLVRSACGSDTCRDFGRMWLLSRSRWIGSGVLVVSGPIGIVRVGRCPGGDWRISGRFCVRRKGNVYCKGRDSKRLLHRRIKGRWGILGWVEELLRRCYGSRTCPLLCR